MVKTLLGFLFLMLWSLPGVALPLYDNPGVSTAAQDAAGNVWALPDYGGATGTLRRWQSQTETAKTVMGKKGDWVVETIPGTAGLQPRALTRGADGAVYVLWQNSNQSQPPAPPGLITVSRGGAWRILARISEAVAHDIGFFILPALWAGDSGDVWLAAGPPILWHISSDGSVAAFPLTAEQHFYHQLPASSPMPIYDSPYNSLTDGTGRRWFWQNVPDNHWQTNTLRGALIWDGKTLGYHPTFSGMPDRNFSVLAPLDTNHFWLSAVGDDFQSPLPPVHGGLYQVDTHTLAAVAETPPQPGAFQNIVQIFPANGDWYAIDQKQNSQTAILWRKHAGKWRECLDQIEEVNYYQQTRQHPWLAEPDGIWLGTHGGLWWLPRNGKPAVWVNWRRGLAISSCSSLFPLPDGSVLAVGSGEQTQIPATPQPIRSLPPEIAADGLGAPSNLGPLLSDPKQHLWGTRTTYSQLCPLDEWDGKRWRTHLPPKSILGINGLYACDTLGRIWLNTSNWNPPAQPQPINGFAVYDPAHDTWTNYATVPEAFQASAMLPNMAFRPYRNTPQLPVFSGDGRITYTNGGTTIYFYDGHAWRQWEARDIVPSYSYGNLGGSPHFNARGHLEVPLDGNLWEWVPPTGWQPAGKQIPEKYDSFIPSGGPTGAGSIPTPDGLGRKWYHWQGKVYTSWNGLWAELPELSAFGSPFADSRSLEEVLPDPAGRLFFVTRPANGYEFIVWSPPLVPKPTLVVVPTAEDAVVIRIQPKLPRSSWFLWRLNHGLWSNPQKTDTLTFTTLPRGDYRVEVQTLDRRLQVSPTAVAVFSIRAAPGAQIARWVSALLHGTDDQRETAVAGLVKQPAAALPALQAARISASDTARWWIDAAIQQIREGKEEEGTPQNANP